MKAVFVATLRALHNILKRGNSKIMIQEYQTEVNKTFSVLETRLPVKWWSFTRHSVCHIGRHLIKHGNFEFNNMLHAERLHQKLHALTRGHKHMMQSICNHLNIAYTVTASMYQFKPGGRIVFSLLKKPLPFKTDRTIDPLDKGQGSPSWFNHKDPNIENLSREELHLLLSSCYGNAGISDNYKPEIRPLKDLLGKYATASRQYDLSSKKKDVKTFLQCSFGSLALLLLYNWNSNMSLVMLW